MTKLKVRGLKSLIYRLAWSGTLHHLWMDTDAKSEVNILKSITHDVRCRLLARKRVLSGLKRLPASIF